MEKSKSTLIIRNAQADDAPVLAGLVTELGFPTSVPVISERLKTMLDSSETVLVATRNGEQLGMVTVHITPVLHRPTPVGRLTALVVTKQARGQGVGRALVMAAEQLLSRRGCELVEVTSNRKLLEAHSFYGKLGYEVTSLRFRKSLAPVAYSPLLKPARLALAIPLRNITRLLWFLIVSRLRFVARQGKVKRRRRDD